MHAYVYVDQCYTRAHKHTHAYTHTHTHTHLLEAGVGTLTDVEVALVVLRDRLHPLPDAQHLYVCVYM